MANGVRPPGSAEKQLGQIVGEVSQKATLLVREEIALAKAEVSQKVKRLGAGAVFLAIAAVMLFYFSLFFFVFLALGFSDWFSLKTWVGFAIVCLLFLVVIVVLGLLALRSIKKGSPPVPALAIEEAKRTRAAIEEVRNR